LIMHQKKGEAPRSDAVVHRCVPGRSHRLNFQLIGLDLSLTAPVLPCCDD
jgi:hypothetical protein